MYEPLFDSVRVMYSKCFTMTTQVRKHNFPHLPETEFAERMASDSAYNMAERNFKFPNSMAGLREKKDQPYDMGVAVGIMLYHIAPLLSTHLDNKIDYQNQSPKALEWAPDFVRAVDQYVAILRLTDGCAEKFPDDLTVDRKARRPRRKFMKRYSHLVGCAYKALMREQLVDIFRGWSEGQTQMFNKGVDKSLSGIQWMVYPVNNVVIEAGEGDWTVWLRAQCEELGKAEAAAGRDVFAKM
jgi:hypothetical protein